MLCCTVGSVDMEVSGSGVNSTMDLSLDMVSSLFPNGGVGTMGGKVMSRSCCEG